MYRIKVILLHKVQIVVANLSYFLHRAARGRRPKHIDWVVGPFEVALLVHNIANAIPNSLSVVLAIHPFYSQPYDWQPSARPYPGAALLRSWLLGPSKLGQLAAYSRGFVYISAAGFINAARDQRHYEFSFLKRHGCAIVCYFTGNDIRSPALMKEVERATGKPNLGTYLSEVSPVFGTATYDEVKRSVADAANQYADLVFNADADQRGYLDKPAQPFLYFHPDEDVFDGFGKFADLAPPVIVHAPSAPVLKGTQVVRAAIALLRDEGYEFDYIELLRVPHEEVTRALRRAHIALNEFYASVPGVFGVEAMAAGCALLTSADEADEPQLPPGSNEAWLVTAHYQIATHLRMLLDNPSTLEPLARRGQAWVVKHAVASVTGAELAAALNGVLAAERENEITPAQSRGGARLG